MELYEVMRTTFSAREFTSDPLPDETLVKILDHARFAPSGASPPAAATARGGKSSSSAIPAPSAPSPI